MLTKQFLLAGQATFTLEIPADYQESHSTPSHYTWKVTYKEGTNGYKDTYFASLLTGPDNESDYTYLGIVSPLGDLRTTRASKLPEDSQPVKLLKRVIWCVCNDQGDRIQSAEFKLHHEGRCGACGRKLTTPESCESGLGPVCSGRL